MCIRTYVHAHTYAHMEWGREGGIALRDDVWWQISTGYGRATSVWVQLGCLVCAPLVCRRHKVVSETI